jgi:hypothetical protein
MNSISIGADPEVFIKDPVKNKFISALTKDIAVCPGTKRYPHHMLFGACQIDGVAIEFNTIPAKNADAFVRSIDDNLSFLSSCLNKTYPDCVISITPTAVFDEDYFKTLPPEAKELGCEPDFNAYTGEANERPETTRPFRTASGHVHVGWTDNQEIASPLHFENCRQITKQLDISLFLPSLCFDRDTQRRTLYGAPGAFRPKPYGCEYRVLSNRWLKNTHLQRWVFNTTLRSVRDLMEGKKYFEILPSDIVSFCRDNCDAKYIQNTITALAKDQPSIVQIPTVV